MEVLGHDGQHFDVRLTADEVRTLLAVLNDSLLGPRAYEDEQTWDENILQPRDSADALLDALAVLARQAR